MAGQPLDGSWAQSRQQPSSHEQADYEQAPYPSHPTQQQYARGPEGDYQQAVYQSHQAPQAHGAHQAYQGQKQESRPATRSKGFVASLFDFSFSSFVTPKLIRALYVLATIWTAILTIAFCSLCVRIGGGGGSTIIFLIFAAPILFLLGLGSIRVWFEVFMVLHRLNENIQAIRDRSDMS
jgi:hypothetical protein